MDDVEYKNLARKALALFRITDTMQRTMSQMFTPEFLEIVEEEERRTHIESDPLPF